MTTGLYGFQKAGDLKLSWVGGKCTPDHNGIVFALDWLFLKEQKIFDGDFFNDLETVHPGSAPDGAFLDGVRAAIAKMDEGDHETRRMKSRVNATGQNGFPWHYRSYFDTPKGLALAALTKRITDEYYIIIEPKSFTWAYIVNLDTDRLDIYSTTWKGAHDDNGFLPSSGAPPFHKSQYIASLSPESAAAIHEWPGMAMKYDRMLRDNCDGMTGHEKMAVFSWRNENTDGRDECFAPVAQLDQSA